MIFRNRILAVIYRDSKRTYNSWIKTLSPQSEFNMNIARKYLRRCAVLHTKVEWQENFRASLSAMIIVPLSFVAVGGYLLRLADEIGYVLNSNISHTSAVALTYTGVGALAGLSAVVGVGNVFVRRFSPVSYTISIIIIGIVFAVIASVMLSERSTNFWPLISRLSPSDVRDYLAIGFLSFAGTVVTIGLFFIVSAYLVVLTVLSPIRTRRSDIVIIGILIDLLHELELRPSHFSDMHVKRMICGKIESASSYLKNALPRAAGITDPTLDQALREQLGASARYLQEVQMRVILADEKTYDEVRAAITHYIYAIALGQYNLLPVGSSIEPKTSKFHRSVMLIRTFIVALIPLGCIVAVRYAGFSLSSQFTGWAVIVAVTWAAITLISTLDPLYKTRLTDVRDLISSIRGRDS